MLRQKKMMASAAVAAVSLISGAANANTIGLQFAVNYKANSQLAPTDSAGLPATANVDYNVEFGNGGSPKTYSNLLDNTGAATTVSANQQGFSANGQSGPSARRRRLTRNYTRAR